MPQRELIAFKCTVCDTRMMVPAKKSGMTVKCPDCFTKLTVPGDLVATTPDQEVELADTIDGDGLSISDSDLTLEPVLERPKPRGGLPTLDDYLEKDDFLEHEDDTPIVEATADDEPIETIELIDETPEVANRSLDGDQKLAAVVPPAVARPTNSEPDGPPPPRAIARNRRKKPDRKSAERKPADREADPEEVPELGGLSWLDSFKAFIKPSNAKWLAIVATLLIGLGSALYHQLGLNPIEAEPGTAMVRFAAALLQFIFGTLPFWFGTLLLWLVASVYYRDAALGEPQASNLRFSAATELRDTFAIFAFSFFLAGLPFVVIGAMWLTLPMRMLLGTFFLVASWHNKSPFAIVSADLFATFGSESKRWKQFAIVVLALCWMGFIGGMMMEVDMFVLSWFTSLIGSVIVAAVTLVFAVTAGWHVARITASME